MIKLAEHQTKALAKMHNGCILCGGTGSGKSLTSLAYYFYKQGGIISDEGILIDMPGIPMDLYIITTAKKRDSLEWEDELNKFEMSSINNKYQNKIVIDSWNNISKYMNVVNSMFIFDEQRLIGTGAWVMAFKKIASHNRWILLTATPADKYEDFAPVFIANGFYKNITEFRRRHIVYDRFSKFPKVSMYLNTDILDRFKKRVLVYMDFERKTIQHHEDVFVTFNREKYKDLCKNRFNYEKNKPIKNASEFCYELRKIVNSDYSRVAALIDILIKKKKVIIFYNFDYELNILREMNLNGYEVKEWNGHKHEDLPTSDRWIYLVQYSAGSEGWNCTTTDTIIFYSQNYSYRILTQAIGRIDRMNTPFVDLYYYHLKSRSGIDVAIAKALKEKKKFNERKYYENK